MTRNTLVVAFALTLALAQASDAFGAGGQCPTSPTNWDAAACGGVCTLSGSGVWTCSVAAATADGSEVYMVADFDISAANFESWGDIDGTLFCCQEAVANITSYHVDIAGSQFADTLQFSWDNLTYNMSASQFSGTITGNTGADTIRGSNASSNWTETLNGDGGNDQILGYGGGDTCNGGSGNDTIGGGAGVDYIYGNAGADILNGDADADYIEGGSEHDEIGGGAGNDTIFGDADGDFIQGGPGDDDIDAGPGGDVVCGGTHTNGDYLDDGDLVDDGATDDKLWGGENSSDTVCCGHNSTKRDANSTEDGTCGTCNSTTLSTEPAECPP